MAKLIPFPKRPPIEPPGTPMTPQQRDELRDEDRRRMLENVAAAVAVVALIFAGFWVIDRVSAYSKNVTCLQFKQKDCR